MNAVIIANCLVAKTGHGVRICPLELNQKLNPTFDPQTCPRISYGNRVKDNSVLSQLIAGNLSFEDLSLSP